MILGNNSASNETRRQATHYSTHTPRTSKPSEHLSYQHSHKLRYPFICLSHGTIQKEVLPP